jgi:hypothetical protein
MPKDGCVQVGDEAALDRGTFLHELEAFEDRSQPELATAAFGTPGRNTEDRREREEGAGGVDEERRRGTERGDEDAPDRWSDDRRQLIDAQAQRVGGHDRLARHK